MAKDRENMGHGFSARLEDAEGVPVVVAEGELDLSTEPRMRQELRLVTKTTRKVVVADLSGLSFMDSSGLGLLIEQRSVLREHGGDLWIVAEAGSAVYRLLEVADLKEAFKLRQDRASAVEEARETGRRS